MNRINPSRKQNDSTVIAKKQSPPVTGKKKYPVGRADASAHDYARIHRLLKIIFLIQGQKGWNVQRLATECGVTVRTIYRDLDMLEGAGIPYFYDKELKCYQIQRAFFLKPVDLTLEESLALVALGEHIGGQEQIPFTRAATKAVAKIRTQLPQRIQQELNNLDQNLEIKLAATASPFGVTDVYEKICRAIAGRCALRCQYDSPNSQAVPKQTEEFIFRPYTLFFSQRAWYVVGHHSGRRELRCLKLNRFSAMSETQQKYAIPPGYSLKKHLGLAWRMIRGSRKYDVQLRFDSQFAETIADTHWHDTQEIDWLDDGSILFRCKVEGLEEIVWWVLSMGPHCTVIKPAELANRVRDLASQVAGLYPPASASE